jgi:hypothetical protein
MGRWERGLGRWIDVATVRRAASTVVAARASPSSSAAVLAGVGSALGAGFLWAATAKPALAEEDGKGKRDTVKGSKVRSALCPVRCSASLLACAHDASLRCPGQEDGDSVKDSMTEAYENRIRAFSAPEKVLTVACSRRACVRARVRACSLVDEWLWESPVRPVLTLLPGVRIVRLQARRRRGTFSNVSALVYLLCAVTIRLTFENVLPGAHDA